MTLQDPSSSSSTRLEAFTTTPLSTRREVLPRHTDFASRDCSCPKCSRIADGARDVYLLANIHKEVERRRRWCLQTDWGDYDLNGYDSDEYHARDSGTVTDSSNDDDSDDDIDSNSDDIDSSSDDG